jgi:hypothetical protein
LLDGKPAGEVGSDGLDLTGLGTANHDLQVTRNRDRQRFILTYTPAPVLTVYVKSDPNSGTLVVMTGEDGVQVFIEDTLYRRRTDHGQVRIPIRVGKYQIRVHKDGFNDPVPVQIEIRKGEESAAQFRLEPASQLASLHIKGATPGSAAYLDKEFVGAIEPDGAVKVFNIKPGDHTIELHHDQALPRKLVRTFHAGEVLVLSGSDVQLDKVNPDAKLPSTPPPPSLEMPSDAAKGANGAPSTNSMSVEGERVMRGGGFVPYHTPSVPGHYSFNAQGRVGGFLKHGKLQWYAGFQDSQNYILFSLDGKHADVREVRQGKTIEWNRVPFQVESSNWVQVDVNVKASAVSARVKTADGGWKDIGTVVSPGRDFTQDRVGFYVPNSDAVAIANFKFANH